MDLQTVEFILKQRDIDKWSIKGEHLCYTDGDTKFLFDKIEEGFFAFRKLVLVSNGKIIPMGFFDKKRIYPHVISVGLRVENQMKQKAIADLARSRRQAPPPPPPPASRPTKPSLDRQQVIDAWTNTGMLSGMEATSMAQRLQEVFGNQTQPSVPNEGQLAKKVKGAKDMVQKTLSDAEQRSKTFKDNVEKEKARIRKLLRKNND